MDFYCPNHLQVVEAINRVVEAFSIARPINCIKQLPFSVLCGGCLSSFKTILDACLLVANCVTTTWRELFPRHNFTTSMASQSQNQLNFLLLNIKTNFSTFIFFRRSLSLSLTLSLSPLSLSLSLSLFLSLLHSRNSLFSDLQFFLSFYP